MGDSKCFHVHGVFSKRTLLAASILASLSLSGAGAATFQRLSVSQTTGSGGATTFLQTSATSSALQGEVASSPQKSIAIPFGVLGEYDATGSTFGMGVAGISATGYGVAGEAFGSNPSVIGLAGGSNVAVEAGASSTSVGSPFEAEADNGSTAGVFNANTGDAIDASANGTDTGQALYATNDSENASVIAANSNQPSPPPMLDGGGGIYTSAQGPGIFAESYGDPSLTSVFDCNAYVDSNGVDGGLGGTVCAGLYVVQNKTNGWPILVYNSMTQSYPMYLDSTGNLHVTGNIYSTGAITVSSAATGTAMTYSSKQTESTVEDFGTAQLQNGVANVPLRADFKATINSSAPYMVFLTPHGDNRGLFVASSGPQGFTIRESQSGRSTLAFDYRIVARPPGAASPRLPHVRANDATVPHANHASAARYAIVRDRMLHRQGAATHVFQKMKMPTLVRGNNNR